MSTTPANDAVSVLRNALEALIDATTPGHDVPTSMRRNAIVDARCALTATERAAIQPAGDRVYQSRLRDEQGNVSTWIECTHAQFLEMQDWTYGGGAHEFRILAPVAQAMPSQALSAIDALDGLGYSYDAELGWLPPALQAMPAAPSEAVSVRDAALKEAYDACRVVERELGKAGCHQHQNGAQECLATIRALQGKPEAAKCSHPFRVGTSVEVAQGGGICSTCGASIQGKSEAQAGE